MPEESQKPPVPAAAQPTEQSPAPFPTLKKKTPESTEPPAPAKSPAVFIIKAIFLIGLHLAATVLLANTGKQVGAQYLNVMLARPESIGLAVAMLIALSAFIITTALVSVLIRPMWLIFATMAVSALTFLLLSGTSTITIVLSILIFAFTAVYAITVNRKLEMQIQFSTYPLTTTNMLLIVILGTLFSACFAQGYINDAAARHFIIPAEYKDTLVKITYDSLTAIFDKNNTLAIDEKSAMQEQTKQETFNMYKDLEAKILPYRDFIPAILGISFFFLIQTPALLTSWIPLLLLSLIFGFLKFIKVIKEVSETREVSHLEL